MEDRLLATGFTMQRLFVASACWPIVMNDDRQLAFDTTVRIRGAFDDNCLQPLTGDVFPTCGLFATFIRHPQPVTTVHLGAARHYWLTASALRMAGRLRTQPFATLIQALFISFGDILL